MRKLILLFILGIVVLNCNAQKIDSVIFKKASKVIIKNHKTASENFKISGQSLIEKGYMIGSKDEQFNQLISEPVKIDGGVQIYYLVAKDNEIDITSKYKSNTAIQIVSFAKKENDAKPVLYSKSDDWAADRFNNMVLLAKAIGYDKLLYSE